MLGRLLTRICHRRQPARHCSLSLVANDTRGGRQKMTFFSCLATSTSRYTSCTCQLHCMRRTRRSMHSTNVEMMSAKRGGGGKEGGKERINIE